RSAEGAQDASVVRHLSVVIGGAFADEHARKMRWLQGCDLPLIHGEIGNAAQANLAVAPRLPSGPFDAIVKILRFAVRPDVQETWRAAGAAGVDPDDNITIGDEALGVVDLEVLVLVGGICQHFWIGGDDPVPLRGETILVMQPFAVGA